MKDTQIGIEKNTIIAMAANGATLHVASVSDGLTPTIVIGDTSSQKTTYAIGYPQHVDWKFAGRGWVGTFGNETKIVKDADFSKISKFVVKRLQSIFAGVAENPLLLRTSKNNPLYLLCFASANPRVAKTAIKLAEHILKRA